MAEVEFDQVQEMRERVRSMFDDGVDLKNQGRHIEALKKFDEV